MNITQILLIAFVILGYGLVSRRLEGSMVTPPMIFVAVGLLVGPHALGLLDISEGQESLHVLAELTLVLVLFGDASRIDVRALRRELGLPVRLLSVGLPLCILFGTVVAKTLFSELSWFEAAVLGAVLAPTDAALGQAVVSNRTVPLRIRQALNVESGLNDGIALPAVMVLAALGSMGHGESRSPSEWATFAALQVTLGPIAGVVVGAVGAKVIGWAADHAFITESFERLSGLALALLAFAGAETIGGNGFIAAFVAGMVFGNVARDRCGGVHVFLEAEGQLLMMLVFLLLGSALLWPAVQAATLTTFLYAALSLTVIRMIPTALSLVGAGLRAPTTAFLGWFGPRGLASVLFGILIVSESALPNGELVFSVTLVTVLFSIIAHGVTAAPLANAYGRAAADASQCPAEHATVATHPLRVRATPSSAFSRQE